jgi:hypothetical protein
MATSVWSIQHRALFYNCCLVCTAQTAIWQLLLVYKTQAAVWQLLLVYKAQAAVWQQLLVYTAQAAVWELMFFLYSTHADTIMHFSILYRTFHHHYTHYIY